MACVEASMPVPDSRKKVDELFLYWLSEPSTQDMLRKELANIREIPRSELDDLVFKQDGSVALGSYSLATVLRQGASHSRTPSPPPSSSLVAKSPSSPRARRSARKSPHGSNLKEKLQATSTAKNKLQLVNGSTEEVDCGITAERVQQSLLAASSFSSDKLLNGDAAQTDSLQADPKGTPSSTAGAGERHGRSRSPKPAALPSGQAAAGSTAATAAGKVQVSIPRFYFPNGKPCPNENIEQCLKDVTKVFQEFPKGEVPQTAFHQVTKAMNLPLYWKVPLFRACIGKAKDRSTVSYPLFAKAWQRITHNCHDDASRFVRMMATNGCNYLTEDDFVPLIQDIVDTHPGLAFLGSAPEFHQRYVETVISRIFYVVDRNWNGRITTGELRRSNFLQVLTLLEEEPDINQITDFFSYEHFYVIYCKFWELDTDHDLVIDAQDLSRHEDHALTSRVINRLLSGVVTRDRLRNGRQLDGKMSYKDFIWFLLSEEDKTSLRSIEYWFRCLDIDGDGVLSLFELVYFYEEVLQRLQELNIDSISIENTICQVLDMVNPKEKGKITLRDLKACRMTPVFFNTFTNIEKYLEYEQRDPVAQAGREEMEGTSAASDWEKYAAEQYDILLQEEQYEQEGFEEVDDEEDLGEDEKEMLAYLQQ